MTKKEYQLEKKISEMEADIVVTSLAFKGILECLGISVEDFKGLDKQAIMKKSPIIAKNISKALISGGDSFGSALNDAVACGPVMLKYAYLFDDNNSKKP